MAIVDTVSDSGLPDMPAYEGAMMRGQNVRQTGQEQVCTKVRGTTKRTDNKILGACL